MDGGWGVVAWLLFTGEGGRRVYPTTYYTVWSIVFVVSICHLTYPCVVWKRGETYWAEYDRMNVCVDSMYYYSRGSTTPIRPDGWLAGLLRMISISLLAGGNRGSCYRGG